jgi:RNA 2',3'-cyclic 3'-phosphodiesterase
VSCVRTRRLFLALWPGDDTRARLEATTASLPVALPARRVVAADLHVTLEFLGTVPEAARGGIEALLASFEAGSEPLVLDDVMPDPSGRTFALTSSAVPSGLVRAQNTLRDQLRRAGLRVDGRPWCAHVTLARGLAALPDWRPAAPVVWPLEVIALCESSPMPGPSRYTPLATRRL